MPTIVCIDCGRSRTHKSPNRAIVKRCEECQQRHQLELGRATQERLRRRQGAAAREAKPLRAEAVARFDDAWFAGFADGEGCFYVGRSESGCYPAFSVALRADDGALLCELRDAFGGGVSWGERTCSWSVVAKTDLLRLAAYFDRFAPRGKKAPEYRLWREAVAVYAAGTRRDPRLREIGEAIMGLREYKGSARPDLRRAV